MPRAGIIEARVTQDEDGAAQAAPPRRSLGVRLGWLALIWAGSVLALGVVGYAIKMMLR